VTKNGDEGGQVWLKKLGSQEAKTQRKKIDSIEIGFGHGVGTGNQDAEKNVVKNVAR